MFWVLGFVFWVLGVGRPLFESCKFDLARFAGDPAHVWEASGRFQERLEATGKKLTRKTVKGR